MKFKVCGLFNEENINKVAKLNPDYVGHIFWEKSVRYLNIICLLYTSDAADE